MPPVHGISISSLTAKAPFMRAGRVGVAGWPPGIAEAHHQDVHHLFLVEHRTLPRASAAEEGVENENGRECVVVSSSRRARRKVASTPPRVASTRGGGDASKVRAQVSAPSSI